MYRPDMDDEIPQNLISKPFLNCLYYVLPPQKVQGDRSRLLFYKKGSTRRTLLFVLVSSRCSTHMLVKQVVHLCKIKSGT